jgi:enamine deaminase RidA (YjgF/YER057c/UK114 family)
MLMLAGVSAESPEGRWMHADVSTASDITGQTRFIWSRISELLGFHGGTLGDIVKVTLYTTDARYLMNPVATVLGEVFGQGPVPACTGVVVSGLAWPELLIEIDITAVVQS